MTNPEPPDDEELPPDPDDPGSPEPGATQRSPRRPYMWAERTGTTPPWAWGNLSPDETRDLRDRLAVFVGDYNATMVTKEDQVIPACWEKHPPLVQVLPPLFYAWWWTHAAGPMERGAPHPVEAALVWHERHLWVFQERLDTLLGEGGTQCRTGTHMEARSSDAAKALAAAHPGVDLTTHRPNRSFGT